MFPAKILYAFFMSYECYIPYPVYVPWFSRPNRPMSGKNRAYVLWRSTIMPSPPQPRQFHQLNTSHTYKIPSSSVSWRCDIWTESSCPLCSLRAKNAQNLKYFTLTPITNKSNIIQKADCDAYITYILCNCWQEVECLTLSTRGSLIRLLVMA